MNNHVKDYECKDVPGRSWTSMNVQIWNCECQEFVSIRLTLTKFSSVKQSNIKKFEKKNRNS